MVLPEASGVSTFEETRFVPSGKTDWKQSGCCSVVSSHERIVVLDLVLFLIRVAQVDKVEKRRKAIVAVGILLACCRCVFTLDPSLDVNQYAHTAWKLSEGFSRGGISSIAQTPDGYFWLGTEFGLLRFDGVRTVPWQPPVGEQLPSSNVISLRVARDGSLCIGTSRGLASWKDSKLTHYPKLDGLIVEWLLEDRENTLWVVAGWTLSEAPPHTATHKLGHQLLNFRSCTSLGR
jgi:hypothetical protein